MLIVLLICAVTLGAALLQRLTGMGFALVSVPFLVIAYGPVNGVLLAMVLGLTASIIILVPLWREIRWKWILPILGMAFIWVPLGAWVTSMLTETVLLVVVGAAGVVSLVGMRAQPIVQLLRHPAGPYLAGSLSAVMHVSSGLSGPPLVALSYSRRMPHLTFVASVQVVFVLFHVLTIGLRGLPALPIDEMLLYVGICLAGTWAGTLLANRVSVVFAQRLTIFIALVGTASVLGKGLWQVVVSLTGL